MNKFNWRDTNATGNGEQVDVVVIGAGPGGHVVGENLAKIGLKSIVIEKEFAGGACLNNGCVPTKALLKSAYTLQNIKHANELGINVDLSTVDYDWTKMVERKNTISNILTNSVKNAIANAGATLVWGEAKVLDKHNVQVGDKIFTTRFIILATGASPIMLSLEGFKDAQEKGILINSDGALNLKEVPKSLVIIGGGVIGVEFATLFNILGTKVTIIEGGPSIIAPMDKDIRKFATEKLQADGVEVLTNAKVLSINGNKVSYELNSEVKLVEGEKVLLSVGRRSNNLNLDKTLGMEVDKRGSVVVNENFQTSIPNIFALGDVNGRAMVAHASYKHADIITEYFKGNKMEWNVNKITSAVFTYPEMASIGKTEDQLIKEGIQYIEATRLNKQVVKMWADGNTQGFTKLLIDKSTGEILGAHMVNTVASDIIAEISTLMEKNGTIFDLASAIHQHPAISEVVYYAALQAREKFENK